PVFALRFRIASRSPLSRVELVRERSVVEPEPVRRFEAGTLSPGADGVFELRAETKIDLGPRPNAFKIVAESAGGVTAARLAFNYPAPRVGVERDGIESAPRRGGLVVPELRVEGPPVVREPLPDSRATLLGRVVWDDQASLRYTDEPRVQV